MALCHKLTVQCDSCVLKGFVVAMVRNVFCLVVVMSCGIAGVNIYGMQQHVDRKGGEADFEEEIKEAGEQELSSHIIGRLTPEKQKELNQGLLLEARMGDEQKVVDLLTQGAQVNYRDSDGRTALLRAQTGELVKVLVEAKADINALDEEGSAPLGYAILGREDRVRELLCGGALVNLKNRQRRTPLHQLILLKSVCKDIKKSDSDYYRMIEILIHAGARVDENDHTGLSMWNRAKEGERDIMLQARGDSLVAALLMRNSAQLVGEVWKDLPTVIRDLVIGYVADLFNQQCKNHWAQELDQILTPKKATEENGVKQAMEENKVKKIKKRDCTIS